MTSRSDSFFRFARAHLSCREDRAVWHALVGSPDKVWTADQMAAGGGDLDLIQGALERFASAGIAERVQRAGEAPRYRWNREMDYLFDTDIPASELIDPVCGMPVSNEGQLTFHDDEDRIYRFCSRLCRAAFIAFPSSFAYRERRGERTPLDANVLRAIP